MPRGIEVLNEEMTSLLGASAPDRPLVAPNMGSRIAWAAAIAWVGQIVVAIILVQTLFFKFTYAPETQVIFASRGGRPAATALGLIELLCAILLLTPRWSAVGALLSLLVISGAIFTHLTSLGIEIVNPTTGQGDGALLFGLAVTVAIGSLIVLVLRWRQLQWIDFLLNSH